MTSDPLPPMSGLDATTSPEAADPEATTPPDGGPEATSINAPCAGGPAAPPLGRYILIEKHAKGGMGEVLRATDTELGREVAFKRIQDDFADREDVRRRFEREARITGNLEHPGVIPVYGLGAGPDGRPYYAMRFVRGDSLLKAVTAYHKDGQKAAGARAIAFRELLQRFVAACNAVAYAHSRGVIHRDLKPDNIMLGPFGETLVVDWGLAAVVKEDGRDKGGADGPPPFDDSLKTQAGVMMGTPAYMPPEQAAGEATAASDVFSLGATLYHLLAGAPPFKGKPIRDLLQDITSASFPAPRRANPAVAPALDAICRKAMSRHPAARYSSPLELAAEVERWLADEPVLAYPEPLGERLRRWAKRNPVIVRTTLAVLLIGLPLLAVGLYLVNEARAEAVEADRLKADALRRERAAHAGTAKAHDRSRLALDTVTDHVLGRVLGRQRLAAGDTAALLRDIVRVYADVGELSARASLRVAALHERLGDAEEAARCYADAIAGLRKAGGERRLLASALCGRARVIQWTDAAEAERAIGEGLELCDQERKAHPKDEDRQADFNEAVLDAADLMLADGRPEEADKLYLLLVAAGAKNAGNDRFMEQMGRASLGMGMGLLRRTRVPPAAVVAHRNASNVFRVMEAKRPDEPRWAMLRLQADEGLAAALHRTGESAAAEPMHREAIAGLRALARANPSVGDIRESLVAALVNHAATLEGLKQQREADAVHLDAIAELVRLRRMYPARRPLRDHIEALEKLVGPRR